MGFNLSCLVLPSQPSMAFFSGDVLFQKSKKQFKCILSYLVPVVFFNLCCFPGPGAGSRRLGLRTTVAIIFGRLVLVPPAGLGIVAVADKLGLFPRDDKMFKFVLLLQHTMPTSVLSGINLHLQLLLMMKPSLDLLLYEQNVVLKPCEFLFSFTPR